MDRASVRHSHVHTSSHAGTLPPDWSSLKQLSTLNLQDNALTGSLPDAWSTLTNLQVWTECHTARSQTMHLYWMCEYITTHTHTDIHLVLNA
jgi:hypothetical protein